MESSYSSDTVALNYADMTDLADELAKQVSLMHEDLDRLHAEWWQMLAASSGEAMTAFSYSAGEWMAHMRAQVAILEGARDWLRRHRDNMREAEKNAVRLITSK